jgi:hypothetical protein
MRLAFRIDLRHFQPYAAICAALLIVALPQSVNAQEPVTASSPDTGSVTLASETPAAATAPDTAVSDSVDAANATAPVSDLAGNVLSIPADALAAADPVLDDQALSQQRGGFGGLFMVAATPQLMRTSNRGNGVTLWDEIAPPSQLPIPVDVARSAQGNLTTYQRN